MNSQIVLGIGAAVLLFWTVGAYNRLVRLRNAIVRRFVPVDEQFKQRQALLLAWCDGLAGVLGEAGMPLLVALRAACLQADAAHARARVHPAAVTPAASLRLADDILSDTRSRVPADAAAEPALAELAAQLSASDATLAFARRQFNDAVKEYNHAVRQFPTWLIAWLFSFRAAALL